MMKLSEIKGMKEYINSGYAEDNTIRAYVVIRKTDNAMIGTWDKKDFAEMIADTDNGYVVTFDEIDFEAIAYPIPTYIFENMAEMRG